MITERKRDPRHLPSAKERQRTTEPLKKGEAERKELKRAVEDLDGGGSRDG